MLPRRRTPCTRDHDPLRARGSGGPAAAALLAAAAVALAAAPAARADSGRLDLHLQPGWSVAVGGVLPELAPPGGPGLSLRLDVAIVSLLAVEVGWTYDVFLVDATSPLVDASTLAVQRFGGGLRLNVLDDAKGWLGQPGGNLLGTLWVAGHAGYGLVPVGDGILGAFAVDGTVGYDLSLVKPISVGLFVRFARYFVSADLAGDTRLEGINLIGFGLDVSLAIGRSPRAGAGGADADGDGLSDAEEAALGSDPAVADSDEDGIGDRTEAKSATKSDPVLPDTDADGLADGEEDKNKNGTLDPGETHPGNPDTDGGGVQDGAEVKFGTDPLAKADDNPDLVLKAAGVAADADGDRVVDGSDRCAGTPAGETVDDTGCMPLGDLEVLFGLDFKAGALDPATLPILDRWAKVLIDHPEATVEIGGHADAKKAKPADLLKWSVARAEAVKARFVAAGVPAERLVTRGYGASAKTDPERTDAAIEANNRVELKKLPPAPPK